jgi:hypothetical protein
VLIDERLHQNAAHFPGAEYGNAALRKIPFHVIPPLDCRVEVNAAADAALLAQF